MDDQRSTVSVSQAYDALGELSEACETIPEVLDVVRLVSGRVSNLGDGRVRFAFNQRLRDRNGHEVGTMIKLLRADLAVLRIEIARIDQALVEAAAECSEND